MCERGVSKTRRIRSQRSRVGVIRICTGVLQEERIKGNAITSHERPGEARQCELTLEQPCPIGGNASIENGVGMERGAGLRDPGQLGQCLACCDMLAKLAGSRKRSKFCHALTNVS